jgi:hypothetical protein
VGREFVRLADREVMAEGRKVRNEYLALVRTVLCEGIEAGEFRDCDVKVQSLLIFGSAQWAWTWFEPGGTVTAEQVGAQLVDLVLGGLLVRRARVTALSDPAGRVARAVRACLAEVAAKGTLPEAS